MAVGLAIVLIAYFDPVIFLYNARAVDVAMPLFKGFVTVV